MSTAPTTGINAARAGIADFGERIRVQHNLRDIPRFKWTPTRDDPDQQRVDNIYALTHDNIVQWIDLSRRNPRGFENMNPIDTSLNDDISMMVNYALNIAENRDSAARLDAQYQAAQATSNVSEQFERNAVSFMTHKQLIEALGKMGIRTDSSLITSSRSDTELRNVLWKEIGKRYRLGGRRRKTKKSKRRARKTRRRHR
jgi:hypothetical protein